MEKVVDIATLSSSNPNALSYNKAFLQIYQQSTINKYDEILENSNAIVKEIDKELKQ